MKLINVPPKFFLDHGSSVLELVLFKINSNTQSGIRKMKLNGPPKFFLDHRSSELERVLLKINSNTCTQSGVCFIVWSHTGKRLAIICRGYHDKRYHRYIDIKLTLCCNILTTG